MVCLGNICRSPLAEGIMAHKARLAGLTWMVDSAGTGGWQRGEAPHRSSISVAAAHGIDITAQKARPFVPQDMQLFDWVYFMDEDNLVDAEKIAGNLWNDRRASLLTEAQRPGQMINIPDPYLGTPADFERVFTMIDDACEAIIKHHQL